MATDASDWARVQIEKRWVGPGEPALIVAEIGQAHDGSLGTAHAYIDAAAQSGADAVKFQTHIAAAESTLNEPFRIRFSPQDDTRFAYWKRMEFSNEQWAGLAAHARRSGLIFLSSPFSVAAVELLKSLRVGAWKVGSGEVFSDDLMGAMSRAKVPVLLSSGMSTPEETAEAVEKIRRYGMPVAVFQCTSMYPTPLEKVGLNVIGEYRDAFGCPVGLSDHSGTVFPALAALARGIDLIEVHVTFDKRLFGPDVAASVTFEELALIAQARDAFGIMDRHPVDKRRMARDLRSLREMFSKSLAPARPLSAGTRLAEDMLLLKKPGTGIPQAELDQVLGRRLARDVSPENLLTWEDLE